MKLMSETEVLMMNEKRPSQNETVILNDFKSDGFLDFYYSSDLKEVIKVLNKLND